MATVIGGLFLGCFPQGFLAVSHQNSKKMSTGVALTYSITGGALLWGFFFPPTLFVSVCLLTLGGSEHLLGPALYTFPVLYVSS